MKRFMMAAAGIAALSTGSMASAALINAGGNVTDVNSTLDIFPVGQASDGDSTTDSRWVSVAVPGGALGDYFADGGIAPIIDFDLGSDNLLDSIRAFGYHPDAQGNSITAFDIQFASAADGPTGFGAATSFSAVGALADGSDNTEFEDFAFAATTARYIRVTVTDNGFVSGAGTGGDRVGGTDFQFNQVPEPGSLALLGLGGLLVARRRRA